ncbi:DUF5977 domain-containing protein [Hymenobacter monticola]|uniref:DUF5977 domain-containing protein n=1 Tax=Hymenobacter monticola TaxID=1705399 RepID=A0ABY4B479_9BACT|nr:hypothetical protein [Hymenobacter monticola]UOE32846.1 hypothetical protein MTP16_17130 [Hymenobacter monticola]
MRVELYINGKLTDLSEDIKITVDKVVSEFKDPLKKTGSYTLPITLPYTNNNKGIFFHEDDKQILGKFKRTYTALLVVDDNLIIDGEFLHIKNSAKGFEGAVGNSRIRSPKIGDLIGDRSLRDIRSFEPFDFSGNDTVVDYISRELEFRPSGNPSTKRSELCFAPVLDSFRSTRLPKYISYEDIGISHFCGTILEKIIQDAGYSLIGNVLNNATYRKLIMLYSDKSKQAWNYGKLAPGRAELQNSGILSAIYLPTEATTIDRQGDVVSVLRYPWQTFDGDLCGSIGGDGVYTCKYTGDYQLTVKTDFIYQQGNATPATAYFNSFRCITDDEFIPENMIPGMSGFSTINLTYLDTGTLAVWTGLNVSHTFTVHMEAGKQYEVQSYVSAPKSTSNGGTKLFYSSTSGGFRIVSCNGPLLVNPALFLPDMKQAEFLNALFKIFNLYYQINDDLKTINLFTRDEFFSRNLGSVVDLSNQISLADMEETPLTSKEVAETYYSYKKDESDYLLNRTDYNTLVNGEQEDGSYVLPFAPLAFVQTKYQVQDGSGGVFEGYDFLPAILPDTESEDLSVLTSEDSFTAAGSWEPRLCLYHGSKSFDPNLYTLPPSLLYYNLFYLNLSNGVTLVRPKLGFFNYVNQPVYKVVENVQRRSFSVELASAPTIYQLNDQNFLRSTKTVDSLDNSSLAINTNGSINPKGMFFNLYANDLLIANLSNYLEGVGRMNPVLFNQLTGRQVLRIDSDLFLLESIKAYELGGDRARYKIYKLIAGAVDNQIGNGNDDGTPATFTSTQTYTASCGTGFSGSPVTETFTADSNISQSDADAKALAGAQQSAEDGLFCLRTYTSTQTYTASCPDGYDGNPVTKTVTFVSTVSQDDADSFALASAQVEALAELVCTYVGGGGDDPGGSHSFARTAGPMDEEDDWDMPSDDFDGDFTP